MANFKKDYYRTLLRTAELEIIAYKCQSLPLVQLYSLVNRYRLADHILFGENRQQPSKLSKGFNICLKSAMCI